MASKRSSSSKTLNKQDLKAFRSAIAQLKKKGIVSKRVDARRQRPTRYMRAKVKRFEQVLAGNEIAVKAPKQVREQYRESGALEVRDNRIIAPKEFSNQRARLSRGLVQVTRPLKNGTEEYVILPFKTTNANELIQRLITDESLDNLKEPDEFFSFRLYGHNAREPLYTAAEMGEYLRKYQVLQGDNQRDAIKHLTFQRFKVKGGHVIRNPQEGTEPKIIHRRADDTGRNSGRYKGEGTWERQHREYEKYRKRKQREKETPEQADKRRAKNALREAQRRQRKFYES